MIKKTITFTDFNGTQRTQDYRFHLSKPELMEMEVGTAGGYTEFIKRIVSAQDASSILTVYKELILKSYGELSPDGIRFVKSPELSEAFSQSPAYEDLFMEFLSSPDAAANFVKGILPGDIDVSQEEVAKIVSIENK